MSVFDVDDKGRTILFHYASIGDIKEVEKLICKLTGTGLSPQRLALIKHKDKEGLTAADVATAQGHQEIADLLNHEEVRMEYYE